MTAAEFLFLSQEDVVAAGGLDLPATIEAVEEALRLYAEGDAVLPQKSAMYWSHDLGAEEVEGRIMAMPAYVGGRFRLAGLKWIPSVPSNPSRGLPRGIGLMILTDRDTGLPVAVMDGTVTSAARTAAVTGIALRHLARGGATRAALLGAGGLARTQLAALESVLPSLEEVRVFDVVPGKAEALRAASARVVPVGRAEEACRGADVVVAATLAREPYVPPAWLGPGSVFVSVSALDADLRCVQEADLVVTDLFDHETAHANRPLARALARGLVRREDVVELPDLVAGRHPGRTSPEQRVFVSPVGLAIEDVAAAARVYRRAAELGLGTRLRLWDSPVWV